MRLTTNPYALFEGAAESSERKRTRPTSSLDFKTENGHKLTTPNRKIPIQQRHYQNQLQQQRELHQQQQQHHHLLAQKPSRAQSSGIPPKNYEFLSRLDGMSEEEIRAAFTDPEFAAYAGKESKRSPYYRDKDGKMKQEHPEHLRAMMEEGIPVKQWIILLLLLGAALWQLRKAWKGPTTSTTEKSLSRKNASPRKGPKKAGNKKGRKGGGGMSAKTNEVARPKKAEEKVATEAGKEGSSDVKKSKDPSSVTENAKTKEVAAPLEKKKVAAPTADKNGPPPTEEAADSKKSKQTKKKKRALKKKVVAESDTEGNLAPDEEKQQQSPEIAATNGSSAQQSYEPDEQPQLVTEGEGWQTVGGNNAAVQDKGKNGSKVMETAKDDDDGEMPKPPAKQKPDKADVQPVKPKDKPSAPPGIPTPPAPAPNKENGKEDNNTKAEVAKSQEPIAAVAPEATHDDAALALKLQEEEQKLAEEANARLSRVNEADSWSEVTPKKSRRRSTEQAAAATSAVTEAW